MDGLQSQLCCHGSAVSTGYIQLYMITGNLSHEFFNKLIRTRAVTNALHHCQALAAGRELRPLGYIISLMCWSVTSYSGCTMLNDQLIN